MKIPKVIAIACLLLSMSGTLALAGNVFALPANAYDYSMPVFTEDPFQAVRTVTVPPGVLTVLARPDGSRYYVISQSATDSILVLNSTFTSVLKRVDLGTAPRAAALSPDGRRLFVLAGVARVFDVTSDNDVEITPSPAPNVGLNPNDVAFSLDSKTAFILSSDSARLTRYDVANNLIIDSLDLAGSPTAISVSPSGIVYVSATNVLYEIDPVTNQARAQIALNGLPGKAAFTEDGRYALLPNGGAFVATGLAFLVDLANRQLAGVVPRTGSVPELVLEQLAAVDNNTFFGVSISTRQLVRVTISPLEARTYGFFLAGKTDVRALAVSRELPSARYIFVATGTSLTRGRLSTQVTEEQTLPVPSGRLVLAGAASTNAPAADGFRRFNDNQSVVGGSTTQPLILKLWDANGLPVFGRTVRFSSTTAGVTFEPAEMATNLDGVALTRATVPPGAGAVIVNATVEGLASPINFTVNVVGGGGAQTGGLVMYSGNGQVVPRGFPTPSKLRVRLTDPAGRPIPDATVSWAITSGQGSLSPSSSKTNLDGIAETTYNGPVIVPPITSWVTSEVSASVEGFDPVVFVVTTIPEIIPGVWAKPTYNLLAPGLGEIIEGRAGETLPGAIKVSAKATGGTMTGHGIPNVGVELVSDLDAETNPTAICVGEGNTALSDATGVASCDVKLSGVIGGPVPIRALVGGGGRDAGTEYQVFIKILPGPPAVITILGGNNQSGSPNTLLTTPLAAQIADQFGHLLAGEPVSWEVVTPGRVSIVSSSSVTDSQGRAQAQVRLGSIGGAAQIRLRAGNAEALFNLNVIIPVSSLVAVSGDGQSARLNQDFARPLVVEARDGAGQPVSGAVVTFTVVSGPATVATATATTGADGRASTTVTAGSTAGAVVIRASSGALSVNFNLTVTLPVASINKVQGDGQSAVTGENFAAPLVVELRNDAGEPVSGAVVTFTVTGGSATLGSATATTGSDGRASTTVRAGASAGPVTVQAAAFTFTVTYNLTVVPPGPVVERQNIRNAISGDPGVSPGGIIVIYGQRIAPNVQGSVVANNGFLFGSLPTELAGVQVRFGSHRAPIYHVNNINGQEFVVVQAPFELAAGGTVAVTVTVNGVSTTVTDVEVKSYQPGIFEAIGPSGQRYALLMRLDGTPVTYDSPAQRGTQLRMIVGGLGQTSPALATNSVGVPNQRVLAPLVVAVNHGGVRVVSAETLPGVVGVYVVTFEVPADTTPGVDRSLAIAIANPDGSPSLLRYYSAIPRLE